VLSKSACRAFVHREVFAFILIAFVSCGTASGQSYAWGTVLELPDDIAGLAASSTEIWAVSRANGDVYRSMNGIQWTKRATLLMQKKREARSMAFSDTHGMLLVGLTDGIHYSTDRGTTWNIAITPTQAPVLDILTTAGNGSVLFAATMDGVIRSTNGGTLWDVDGLDGLRVNALVHENRYFHAATANGIFTRSETLTWSSATISYPNHSAEALAVGDSGRVFASLNNAAQSTIVYSTDNGASWITGMYASSAPPAPAPMAASSDGRLFAYVPYTLYSWRQPSFPREETRLRTAIGSNDFDARDMVIHPVTGHAYICGWYDSPAVTTGRIYRSAATTAETAAQLSVTRSPQTTRSGWNLSPSARVEIRDASGIALNRTGVAVAAMLSGGTVGAQLGGTTTRMTGAGGIATFPGLSIDKSGNDYELVFHSTGLQAGVSDAFDIIPGGPAQLAFTAWPASGEEDVVLDEFVVEMRDSLGNLTTNIEPDLLLTHTPATGNMSGTAVARLTGGAARWDDIAMDTRGTYTFAAEYGSILKATTPPIPVTPAPEAVAVQFVQDISVVRAGEVFPARVHLIDINGNRVWKDTREVRLRLGNIPPPDTLEGVTALNAEQGEARFDQLILHRAGTGYFLIAEADGLPDAVSNTFTVVAGLPTQLRIMSTLPDVNVDELFSVPVEVLDTHGNRNLDYTQDVSLALRGAGAGQLQGITTRSVRGMELFTGLTVDDEGEGYRIEASSAGLTSDISNAFDVHPTEGNRLRFTIEPAGGSADAPLATQPRVVVEDKNGRTVTVDGLNVTLSVLDQPGVSIVGGSNPVPTTGGVAMFSGLAIREAGSGYRLLARASGMISDTSAAFSIEHGTAAQLLFRSQPGNAEVNASIPAVVIGVEDQWQNTAATASLQVSLSIEHDAGGGAILAGGSPTSTVNGEARFEALSLNKAGTGYTLRATSPGLPNAVSKAFDITGPGAAFRLVFDVQPTGGPADQPLSRQPVVTVLDAEDRLVENSTARVELEVMDNRAELLGTAVVNATQGRASFSGLRIGKASEGYALIARSNGLIADTSLQFDITPGSARFLTWFEQPSDVGVNEAIVPAIVVGVVDSEMNIVESSDASLTLGILDNPGTATLQGTTVRTVTDGLARFDDISLDAPGMQYTLRVLSPGFQELVSRPFDVIGETELIMSIAGGDNQQGEMESTLPLSLEVKVRDSGGAPAEGIEVAFALQQPDGASGGMLDPTEATTGADGLARTTLTLGNRLGSYSVTAASAGVTGGPLTFTAQAVPPPYPATVQLDHGWGFPVHEDRGAYSPLDYRIIALPGNSQFDISELLIGDHLENWKLFTDDGSAGEPSDYLLPYDGSALFLTEAGRGFWLLHRGDVDVQRTVPSAPVDAGRNARIALHEGWNLIGNPFPRTLRWSVIQAVNGVVDPLYRFDDIRTTDGNFEPYFGYYYYNRDDRSELRVPWDSTFSATRVSAGERGWTIDISLEYAAMTERMLSFGVHPEAGAAFDKRDWPRPRGLGGVFAYFPQPGQTGARHYGGRDLRNDAGTQQQWTLLIEAESREAVTLDFGGLELLPGEIELLLEDPRTGERLDLKRQSRYTIFTEDDPYRLHILARPVQEDPSDIPAAQTSLLDTPYPNPTSRGAVVALNLPHDAEVQLTVRDVLGRLVRRLHAGVQTRGRSLYYWDGRDDAGQRAVAGLYFIHLRMATHQESSSPVILLAP